MPAKKIGHLLITATKIMPSLQSIWHSPPWSCKWNEKFQAGVSYTSASFSPSTIHLGLKRLSPALGSAHAKLLCVSALYPEGQELPGPSHLMKLMNVMLLITFVQKWAQRRKIWANEGKESSWKNLELQKAKTLQKGGFCFSTASSGDTCFLLYSSAKCCYVCEFISVA